MLALVQLDHDAVCSMLKLPRLFGAVITVVLVTGVVVVIQRLRTGEWPDTSGWIAALLPAAVSVAFYLWVRRGE